MNNEFIISGLILFAIVLALFLIPAFAGPDIYFLNSGTGQNTTMALDNLTDVTIINVQNGQIIVYNSTLGQWVNVNQTTISDATTCNNVGSGVLICAGGNVNLKTLVAGTGISITNSSTTITITNTLPESTVCNNLGSGTIVCSGGNVNVKSFKAGTGLSISNDSTSITYTNTSPESTICVNVGSFAQVYKNGNCNFRTLKGSSDISIIQGTNDITIDYNGTLASESTVCINDGHGTGIVCNGGNVHLKGIASGSGITITQNGTDIIVTSNAINESTVCSGQSGNYNIVASSSGGNCTFKNLVAGTGESLSSNSTHITITNSLPESTVCSNVGTGTFIHVFGSNCNAKSLKVSAGLSISNDTTSITLTNTGVTKLNAGTGITVNATTGNILVTNSAPESTVCTNLGSVGEPIYVSGNCSFKKLLGSLGIILQSNGTRITILNAYACTSAGGTTLIKTSNSGGCTLKGLTGTSPIVITSNTDDNAISCPTCKVTGNATEWNKICDTTLGSSATSISCTFSARQHLYVNLQLISVTSTMQIGYQFNSDTGTNYAWRQSLNNGVDTTGVSTNQCLPLGANNIASGEDAGINIWIDSNQASQAKVGWGNYAGDTATAQTVAPARAEHTCKWANFANQITTITFMRFAGTGLYNTNTELIVWGYD